MEMILIAPFVGYAI